MASLLLVLLASVSCRLTGPFRSWQTEAERLRGPQVEAEPAAAAKDTDARVRPRPVSIRERLEKDGWRLTEKLLTDMLEDMMDVWKNNGEREGGCNHGDVPQLLETSASSVSPPATICILI